MLCTGGKGKKAKSLALNAEQETLLAKVTGLIRFLTMLDVNKARLTKLGAVPALITLVNKASRAALRYNARSILSEHLCWQSLHCDPAATKCCLKSHATFV